MKTKILSLVLVAVLGLSMLTLTGCGVNQGGAATVDLPSTPAVENIDNNDNYMFKIKGETFKAGDKIADLAKVGLTQTEKVSDTDVKKNTYMIGAGSVNNAAGKRVINVTPYNITEETIKVKDAVIGGFEAGEYEYGRIPQEVLDLDIEVAGGIKFGSTLEDIKAVFGEPTREYFAESLGYTSYTFSSKEIYRSYEFTIGKDGKLGKINWQNLVFNK